MRFVSNIEEVRLNALKLHGYAHGSQSERDFHRIRVRNALHHVVFDVEGVKVFAPVKWSGARNNEIDNYHVNKGPVTDNFRRALIRIGFKTISPGSVGHEELYRQFVEYCAEYGFTHSKPPKNERYFYSVGITESRIYPDELSDDDVYSEGAKSVVFVNRYERDPKARNRCIELHGVDCAVCNLNFSDTYGPIGEGFIHVHHKKLISKATSRYEVDPVHDLVPVCPNCHAMLHRRSPPFTIDELVEMIALASKP